MDIKYTNISIATLTLQSLPKLGIFGLKRSIWQPCSRVHCCDLYFLQFLGGKIGAFLEKLMLRLVFWLTNRILINMFAKCFRN
jgi:hypothetical protein